MLRALLAGETVQPYGVAALLLCLAAFVAIVARTLSRPRAEVEHQAGLPLDDGDRAARS